MDCKLLNEILGGMVDECERTFRSAPPSTPLYLYYFPNGQRACIAPEPPKPVDGVAWELGDGSPIRLGLSYDQVRQRVRDILYCLPVLKVGV